MASLFPLRGIVCPPPLVTAGAGIIAMLNGHYIRGSAGTMAELGPSRIQPTLDLNRDFLIGAGQNLNWWQTPSDGCYWSSESCSPQKAAK